MSNPSYPPPYTIHPTQPHTHTIILLHGTSTSGPEFGDPFLSFPFLPPNQPPIPLPSNQTTLPTLFPTIKWVFPTGTLRHVTVLNRALHHAWFDMHSFADRTLGEEDQILGLRQSTIYLSELVRSEVDLLNNHIDNNDKNDGEDTETRSEEREGKKTGKRATGKVILGGFSQGAAMTSFLLLSGQLQKLGVVSENRIAGFVCMSGWLPFRAQIQDLISRYGTAAGNVNSREASKGVIRYVRDLIGLDALEFGDDGGDYQGEEGGQISYLKEELWIANGNLDQKVLLKWGEDLRDVLVGVGSQVEMDVYGVGHAWNEEMMQGLVKWIVELWGDCILGGGMEVD